MVDVPLLILIDIVGNPYIVAHHRQHIGAPHTKIIAKESIMKL